MSEVDAREEERRHIARELHDELGQRLTALKMELSGLLPQAPHERIELLLEMVDDTMAAVRRIASNLRPMMLDDLGLNAAIEWLAHDASHRIGVEVELHLDEIRQPISAVASIALYRMVQEALTNVARHARATAVRIEIQQQAGELVLTVEDNGVGFPAQPAQPDHSLGLMGIRERAQMLGGRAEIGPAAGGGAQVVVRIPLHPTGVR